ncbi:peptidylprolyl isomerase [Paenibacillus roseipurpureus]|uniref:Peptidylprolyl isomerase n=1 Tax=Paenibacillus roseopurpureus TaxID=2918901 RepID=A0AA96LWL1_9BACL|nr:peptidylprolyl isomerase [Paenibacillus sp. MBLB1832]WNR46000.1 peptidylprolyl isomerase [Paenibacillus sp. MBLB1832]
MGYKLRLSIIVCLSILALIASGIFLWKPVNASPDTVMSVNGTVITTQEFELITGMSWERAGAKMTNEQKNQLVRTRVIQLEAKKRGIPVSIDYAAFTQELQKENLRRATALNNHEPIYGPKQYSERMYFDYRIANITRDLRRYMQEHELDTSDVKLGAYYEANKDQVALKLDSYAFQELIVPDLTDASKGKAEELLNQLRAGANFDHIYAERSKAEGLTASEFMNEDNRRSFDKYRSVFFNAVHSLKQGEVALEAIEDQDSYKIVKCTKRETAGYKTFEEAKNDVLQRYLDAQLESYLKPFVLKAKVTITMSHFNFLRIL